MLIKDVEYLPHLSACVCDTEWVGWCVYKHVGAEELMA